MYVYGKRYAHLIELYDVVYTFALRDDLMSHMKTTDMYEGTQIGMKELKYILWTLRCVA